MQLRLLTFLGASLLAGGTSDAFAAGDAGLSLLQTRADKAHKQRTDVMNLTDWTLKGRRAARAEWSLKAGHKADADWKVKAGHKAETDWKVKAGHKAGHTAHHKAGHKAAHKTRTATASCSPGVAALDFSRAEVTHSNLGGRGPDDGDETIVFAGVAILDDVTVDLVVSAASGYRAEDVEKNGLQGPFGFVNLENDHFVDLDFTFVDQLSGDKVEMPPFYFSLYNLGQGVSDETARRVIVQGLESYQVGDDSRIVVTPLQSGEVAFAPVGPDEKPGIQNALGVTLKFNSTEQFSLTFAGKGDFEDGNHIMFSGPSSLVCSEPQCLSYKCPAGYALRASAAFLVCGGAMCTRKDLDTCCETSHFGEAQAEAAEEEEESGAAMEMLQHPR